MAFASSTGSAPAFDDRNVVLNLRYTVFLGLTAALGGLLFGFDVGIVAGAGPFIVKAFALTDIGLGWAFSSLLFGCVVGAILSGSLTDRYGRRRLLIVVAILFALTSVATALAPSFALFALARFIGGIAVGGVSLLSPMYVSEVSPSHIRGRMGAMYQIAIVVGILMSYSINYLLRNTGVDNWRWMFFSGVFPSAVFLTLIYLAPESPRFLMLKRRSQEAFEIMKKIAGSAGAQAEIDEITATLRLKRASWRDLLRPGVRRAVIASVILAVLIHVSGVNTIVDYAPTIFQSAGWKMDSALASTFLVGVTELLFTCVSLWIIDRYGRKPLYVIGSLGMAASLFALVATVLTDHFHGSLVLALILTYLAFFSACIGPVFWTLLPELFPNDVRGTAMTVPVLVQWIANAVVVLFFPFAFHVIGKGYTFGFLALMSLCQALFTWVFLPETRNVHLEKIESHWMKPKPAGHGSTGL